MNSAEITQTDKDLIWHPFTPLVNPFGHIPIKSAKGAKLFTHEGQTIIDAVSSWWVNIHGHANEQIADAIHKQALELEHVIFAGFTHEPAVRLAKNLMTILPDNYSKIFFSDNGSTSIEVALKMAFQYWYNQGKEHKTKIIALDGAYHGDTFGSMSVSERSGFTRPFFPFLFDIESLDFPTEENFDKVLAHFDELTNDEACAAFIFEPLVQGAGGMRMYSPEMLQQLISLAQSRGVICIADEVMTGWGRTGTTFACDQIEASPDITCISKGITGGALPLGITACNSKIEAAFQSEELSKALLHGHSYTGNPMICAAANASFEIFESPECKNNIQRVHNKHLKFVEQLKTFDKVENIRLQGTIVAFDLKGFGETGYDSDARKKIYPYFLERGVLIRPLGNVIYLLPPYVITDDELDLVYETLLEFLRNE
ncbi:adenosylmethionine--8-amino-7-oxononanoate transaminase [Reichenbachiella carrageenanivorans]|uniref:Adenosylmethionine-8-amino-7-oxononanoate aminotransferase n=1 Tax=Reichenbachiella carrageenanivorans TaxID=2979869 RepID=A0ABY6D823_9BACT|nr:adenosylmethionine--8-amino-7-oxononanoate transaminase [Reichenbachiella carrageenanivorans]UXX81223.1 adenosylmethionine--8-amino-7-oxononanoate transaminase [Reichenbachiella carrageenanivorans]